MSNGETREVWQRGAVEGVPPLLQPAAHALLQAVEDAEKYADNLPAELLWERPAGLASPGFHLLHMRGVVDRLFTYARGSVLTPQQLSDLSAEKEVSHDKVEPLVLVKAFRTQVEIAIEQLKNTPETTLTEIRTLGRKKLPTTVVGLLFHAAEHCQRHIGQLLVTVRVLTGRGPSAIP